MRRTWCFGPLLAPALAADPAADLAAGRWEAYLDAVGAVAAGTASTLVTPPYTC